MTDELERNLERLIRTGYGVEPPSERLRRDLLPKILAWQDELLARSPKPSSETPRRGTRRPARHARLRERKPSTAAWVPAFVAAALIMAVILLAAVGTSGPPSGPPRETVKRTEAPTPPGLPASVPAPRPETPRPEPLPAPRPNPSVPQSPPVEPPPASKPVPVPAPPPAPRPEPAAPAAPPPAPETVVALARIERAEGEASRVMGTRREPARVGQAVASGDGLETLSGTLLLRYADGTALEVLPETRIRNLREDNGKRVSLDRGTLRAEVARQPPGNPMTLSTPHSEARVLGTALTLAASPDQTRLDVREGRVRLTRLADGASVEVLSDHFAVAATGLPLVSRRIPERPAFLFADDLQKSAEGAAPPGWECQPAHWIVRTEPGAARVAATTGVARFMPAVFGDPEWTDYALVFDGRGPYLIPLVLYQGFNANYRIHFGPEDFFLVKRHGDLVPGSDEVMVLLRPHARATILDEAGHGDAVRRKLYPRHGLQLRSDRWYSVRVEVRQEPKGPRIRARLWERGLRQPAGWHVDFVDEGTKGPVLRKGRAGFFGYFEGSMKDPHVIDNIRVEGLK